MKPTGPSAVSSFPATDVLALVFDAVLVRGMDDGRIVHWNRGAQELYGWTSEQALGKQANRLLKSRYPSPIENVERSLIEIGTWQGDVQQEDRYGRALVVTCRLALLRGQDGRAWVAEVHSDITRRAAAERGLAVSSEMFRLLVESVRDYAIFLLDPHGVVTTWNEGAQRIKGYAAGEIIGRHFSTFYRKEEVDAGKPDWELVAAAREGRFEDEGWRVRKDGSMFWANVVITALYDDQKMLRGFAKVTRDLTARKLAEDRRLDAEREKAQQARLYAERMARLEKVKADFLNLASHELRSPLSVVSGYLSMFADGSLPPEQLRPLLPTLLGKLREIEAVVSQMLETARLDEGRLDLAMEVLDLRDIARAALAGKRPLLRPEHQLTTFFPETPVLVIGDRARLITIASNLLDNAIKYSPSGGEVNLTVAQAPARAFLSVRDRGIGMDMQAVDGLFSRFARYVPIEHSNISGTGLGLYLARELARRHGGDILVESELGVGSRFTLTLPVAAPG